MKKILAWVLVLVLLVGTLAGCGCAARQEPEVPATTEPPVEGTDFVPEGATAEEAMKYLCAVYKDTEEPTPTPHSKSEAETRLELFMNLWCGNSVESMVNYVQPSWASTAPSSNSTMEWMMLWGCTATRIFSAGRLKR